MGRSEVLVTSRRAKFSVVMLAAAVLLAGCTPNASSRPNSSEALPKNPEGVLYVDGAAGAASDDNPGTSDRPLRTLVAAANAALELNAKSTPVRVRVRPATYRESIELKSKDSTTAGILFEGTGEGVVVSGSDVLEGWSPGEAGTYVHDWTKKADLSTVPPGWLTGYISGYLKENPVILRQEMVFVDGRMLEQVMSKAELMQRDSAFYVSEEESKLYIRRNGLKIDSAIIEASTRPKLFAVEAVRNVTIKGLSFQRAASPPEVSAVAFANTEGARVEDSDFEWNSWSGLHMFNVKDAAIQASRANNNGVAGFTAVQVTNLIVEDSETSTNGWRGSRGSAREGGGLAIDENFLDFAGGQKFFQLRNAVFRRHRAESNLSGGLWFDYDNAGVKVEDSILSGNLTHGLMIEANQGPVSVTENVICGNETGVVANNSQDTQVVGNVIGGNRIGQIFIAGIAQARSVEDWETNRQMSIISKNWSVKDNVLSAEEGQSLVDTYLGAPRWSDFIASLTSAGNSWHSTSESPFRVTGGQKLSFEQWKQQTKQDSDSKISKSPARCPPSETENG